MFLTREFRVAPAMILWFWRVTTYQVWISWSQKQIIIVKASKQNLWTTLIPYLLINFSRWKSLCGTEISSDLKKPTLLFYGIETFDGRATLIAYCVPLKIFFCVLEFIWILQSVVILVIHVCTIMSHFFTTMHIII